MLSPPLSPLEIGALLYAQVTELEALGLDREAAVEAVTAQHGIHGAHKVVYVIQIVQPDFACGATAHV